jgi:hypothetical protein
MVMVISRRTVLTGVGQAAAFGSLAATLPRQVWAQAQGDAALCMSMYYPNAPGATFDEAAFGTRHLPLLREVYGDSVERIELRTLAPLGPMGPMGGPGGPPPPAPSSRRMSATPGSARSNAPPPGPPPAAGPAGPGGPRMLAAVSIWINDIKGFAARLAASNQRIADDLKTITSAQPAVQYDRVIALLGDARSAIAPGTQVSGHYYAAGEGMKFDQAYYTDTVIPLMVKLYGEKTFARIECTTGLRGNGGGQPALVASAHFYVRDMAAWGQAAMTVRPQLSEQRAKFTNITPMTTLMRVAAAG